jgi:hypothetical protein
VYIFQDRVLVMVLSASEIMDVRKRNDKSRISSDT